MYWTYTVVAQRTETQAKHPNFRKDSCKVRSVQTTQQMPGRLCLTGFCFSLWLSFIIFNHRWASPLDGGTAAICSSILNLPHLKLEKRHYLYCLQKILSEDSAFQRGQFGALANTSINMAEGTEYFWLSWDPCSVLNALQWTILKKHLLN